MAEPINANFIEIDAALRQERLNIGGYGVSYGLDATLEGLTITFKEGHVVDKAGYSYGIPATTLTCAPPAIELATETCDVLHDGSIFLKHVPYGLYGTSEKDPSRIIVKLDQQIIEVINIDEYRIKINKDYAYKTVQVDYYYALSRIDSIIVENSQLKIIEGVSSLSPSVRPQDTSFCVACVLIDPYYTKKENYYHAALSRVHEQEHLRNIYTDSNNDLYLDGIRVNLLGFVYFERPEVPTTNMLWYDRATHKLYTYLSHEWVAIDNQSMTPVCEFKLFTQEDNPPDAQTFLFHKTEDLNMRFMAGQNELSIIIDQYPLFKDQFKEITYQEALQDSTLRELLPLYGYSYNESFNEHYENIGIGFALLEPLKTPSYVEAKVMHRVVDANIHSRHQRSASFVHTGFVDLEPNQTVFTTTVPYRYNENQLQLMTADKNLFEHFDYEEIGETQGDLSRTIELARAFGYNQRIHYRITTNVYSYDHVATLLDEAARTQNAQ